MTRLLIDTDVGGDIDDALTLAMALNEPALDIVGVTNVYLGNAWRGGITRNILAAFDRADIPVVFGAEKPMVGSWGAEEPGRNEAAAFIIQAALAGPLTVLAIGPMTNLGLALSLAPEIAKDLTVYAMGGMVTRAHPEWNILCDPEAAQIVLQSGARVTLVGLDVTEKCRLDREESLALVAGESKAMICLQGEMDRFLTSFQFLPTLHDPLTLLCLLEEDVCTYEMKDIQVETQGEFTRGVTVDRRFSEKTPVRVAVGVDAARAVGEICRRVRQKA